MTDSQKASLKKIHNNYRKEINMSQGPKQGPPSCPRSLTPIPAAVDKGSSPIPLYALSTHPTSALSLADHVLPPHHQSRPLVERAWAWSAPIVHDNRGSLFVLLSQFFGSTMSLCTRVLETSVPEQKMHAMQILFIRQSVTTVVVCILIVFRGVEHAPWGPRGVRWLLVARGFGGFFGVFGLYCSYYSISHPFLRPIIRWRYGADGCGIPQIHWHISSSQMRQ